MSFDFISLFVAAVLAGTPLLLGTLGEILTEKILHSDHFVEPVFDKKSKQSSKERIAY